METSASFEARSAPSSYPTPTSPAQGVVLPNPKRTRSRGKRGCPTGSKQTLDAEYLPPRETGGGRKG
jgi:hypothetical protein